ncbi:MAG: sulfatase-like hydrolase/transferase [Lentisphaerae bacterium]|jgi:hypothetical protein|nr:sulfatase-like hydrolase/transferase [Lentisphaerota bacterium]MBT4817722.1 sulfatase-like hydrolase/transferase [Lentisphaerota bacterium]MBT5605721.1 sulfatase-like hydrolase/transferase [Lentisphaerota bacterium]MBT7055424.1 sulfatase-like hydrolase/transferase [Lentisphaerota bacterium]MBT7844060.1 sulfatase-like hydrolase/transferase [Lentisphaerota bacterium]
MSTTTSPLALAVIIFLTSTLHAAGRPNFVVILADDMCYNALGYTGSKEVTTPNIDSLCEKGVFCTNALYLRYKDQNSRMRLPFGEILPRFSPKRPSWRPGRLAGADFGCLPFGPAALHPGLGMEFFREKSRFTFEKRP